MAETRKSQPIPPAGVDPLPVVEATHAPFQYFDGAPNFSFTNGIVSITLVTARHLPQQNGQITIDLVVTAYLKTTVQGALHLRSAIDGALLLASPPATGETH